jgi:hypothetical protein
MPRYLYIETYEVKKHYYIYADSRGKAQIKVNECLDEPDREEEALIETEIEQDEF